MGIAIGDLDGDGAVDLAVTNYFGESTTFYRNLGQGFLLRSFKRDQHGRPDAPAARFRDCLFRRGQ